MNIPHPVGPDAAEGLYRLVDAAYEQRSIAVSSNLHPSGFDEIMPKTLATVPQWTAYSTTPTSAPPKATASASPRPSTARG